MFDFIQKLMYSVLSIQEKVLRKRLRKKLGLNYSQSISKKVQNRTESLVLISDAQKNKIKLENNVKTILKKYENNPQKLLEFVQRSGTNVYKIPFANKILALIHHEEGFVSTVKGFKGLYLNIMLAIFAGKKLTLSLKTEPMFLLRDLAMDNYIVIRQFHKWCAMKLNLPGFEADAQNNLQKFLNSNNESVKSLTIDEILGLKDAIARDIESINFIVDFAKSTTGSRNAMSKITAGGASV